MIEDTENGLDWAIDWGLEEGEVLPDNVEELSEARYALHRFAATLRMISNPELRGKLEVEAKPSGLLVPRNGT